MFERFTVGAREVVTTAVAEASSLGHPAVGPEHVLLGLLHPGVGVGREVLNDAGLTPDRVREAVRHRYPAAGFPTADDAESLRSVGIDLDEVMARLEQTLGADALAPAAARRGGRRFTPVAKKTLQLALRDLTPTRLLAALRVQRITSLMLRNLPQECESCFDYLFGVGVDVSTV